MSTWLKLAALAVAGTLCSVAEGRPFFTEDSLVARAPSTNKTVIIQMFEWTWDSVAAECTNFIGPAAYGFVQGSVYPIQSQTDTDRVPLQ